MLQSIYHVGQKEILATPMNRLDYNIKRGWELPKNENGEDEGYLVEYLNGGEKNTDFSENYVSWSPKKVFEKAYRKNGELTFGMALEQLKKGKKVCRTGWNGKGMFLFLLPAGQIPKSAIHDPKLREVLSKNNKDHFEALGSIRMKTADDKILTGWLPSQTDMLSEDWLILD